MLFGDHAVVHGQPCIVTAVNQRLSVSLHKIDSLVFRLSAPDLGLQKYERELSELGHGPLPKAVNFIETCYRIFAEKYQVTKVGIEVTTKSDFSSLFGFGSSSAATVAFAKSLTHLFEMNLSEKELFSLCYETVLAVQGVGSGFDIAAAIWGETLYYTKNASIVEPLRISELPLIIGYTGYKADTATIVRQVGAQYQEHPERIGAIFHRMGEITYSAKEEIILGNWETVGKLMNESQALLHELQVSSDILDTLVESSLRAGAYGAKLSGAGVGDCMIALAPLENTVSVQSAITQSHGTVIDIEVNAPGVRLEKNV